jgi:hypothetical protein
LLPPALTTKVFSDTAFCARVKLTVFELDWMEVPPSDQLALAVLVMVWACAIAALSMLSAGSAIFIIVPNGWLRRTLWSGERGGGQGSRPVFLS